MIIRFIYTECVSPGPFKNEAGYKYKSALVPQEFGGGDIKERAFALDSAVSIFLNYEPPEVDPLLSKDEFLKLPQSWVFSGVDERNFVFARMFTSGRRGNRTNQLVEGFLFEGFDWTKFTSKSGESRSSARPVDYLHSTGWQNPMGDKQLEDASIPSAGFYQLEQSSYEFTSNILEDWLPNNLASADSILGGFAQALVSRGSAAIPKSEAARFYNWVSLTTRLVPQVYAWVIGFSDTWGRARSENTPEGANAHFILSDTPATGRSESATLWTSFASRLLKSESPLETVSMVDNVANAFLFDRRQSEQGLAVLPLTYLLLDEFLVGDSEGDIVNLAGAALCSVALPSRWASQEHKDRLLDALEDNGKIGHKSHDFETIHSRLSSIPVIAKEG